MENKQLEIIEKIKQQKRVDNPKVSVIVPVYKVDKYLSPCLDSIINQTLKEIEIIIVDEGEQDRCREIIDYYESRDPRIVAPHDKNGGYGASCNKGMDIARGEYLAFVESDDMIEPEMLEEMYAYAKKIDADIVKTPFYYWDGEDKFIDCEYRRELEQQCPFGKTFSMKEFGQLLNVHASLWSGLYRTSYMKDKKIRFVEAKGGAYVDVGFRIDTLINSDKIAWLDKPYYIYRTTNEDSTTNNFNLSSMLLRWKEVHEKFLLNQKDYDEYYGKELIFDEYRNTLGYIFQPDFKISKEQINQMEYNFKYVKESVIEDSKKLSEFEKSALLQFKNNPVRYVKKIETKKQIKKIYMKFCCMENTIRDRKYIFKLEGIFFVFVLLRNLIQKDDNKKKKSIFIINHCLSGIITIICIFLGMTGIRKITKTLLYCKKGIENKKDI